MRLDKFVISRGGYADMPMLTIVSSNDSYAKFDSDLRVENDLDVTGDAEVNGKLTLDDVINLTAQASAPSSPATGDIYLDNGANTSGGTPKLRYYNGSTWIEL